MSTSDRYRRLSSLFESTVSELGADDWQKQSPCEDWSALDVLDHVLTSEADVITRVDLAIERTIDVASDPVAAWREVSNAVQAILDDPEKSSLTYESLGAETTITATIDSFLCFDLIVHRWDIATAAGLVTSIEDQDVAAGHAFLDKMGSMFYEYGASGPAIPMPEDSSDQDKLLGRAGRDPHWSAP